GPYLSGQVGVDENQRAWRNAKVNSASHDIHRQPRTRRVANDAIGAAAGEINRGTSVMQNSGFGADGQWIPHSISEIESAPRGEFPAETAGDFCILKRCSRRGNGGNTVKLLQQTFPGLLVVLAQDDWVGGRQSLRIPMPVELAKPGQATQEPERVVNLTGLKQLGEHG